LVQADAPGLPGKTCFFDCNRIVRWWMERSDDRRRPRQSPLLVQIAALVTIVSRIIRSDIEDLVERPLCFGETAQMDVETRVEQAGQGCAIEPL